MTRDNQRQTGTEGAVPTARRAHQLHIIVVGGACHSDFDPELEHAMVLSVSLSQTLMHATVHSIGAFKAATDVLRAHATHAEFVFCKAGSVCIVQGMNHTRTVLITCRLPIENVHGERFSAGINLQSLHRLLRRCDDNAEAAVRLLPDGDQLEIAVTSGTVWKILLCDLDGEHFHIPTQGATPSCLVSHPATFVASLCAHAPVLTASNSRWCNVGINPTGVQITVVQENGGSEEGVHGSTRWDAAWHDITPPTSTELTVAHEPMLSFFGRIPVRAVQSVRVMVAAAPDMLRFFVRLVGGGELCLVLAASVR